MKFEDLQEKVTALIQDYNRGLDTQSDERVTMAELHLARSPDMCTEDKPGLVHVVPPEFKATSPDGEGKPASLSAAAPGSASNTHCCAVGWMGVVVNGVFMNCFPSPPGFCTTFQGPNKCVIPPQ